MGDGYAIWLPFQLSPGNEITGLENTAEGEVLGYPAQLQGHQPRYILTVRGLGSEEDANSLLDKLGAGLVWTATEHALGVRFSLEPQTVVYPPDPHEAAENIRRTMHPGLAGPVDAILAGDRAAVYRADKAVYSLFLGDVSPVCGATPDSIFSHISKGAALPNAILFVTDKKLRLAFDLYCLSHFETTEPARFLTLCTALEVLAPSPDTPTHLQSLIDTWIADAHRLAKSTTDGFIAPQDRAKHQDYQQLANRLASLKKQSHTGRIRDYVRYIFTSAGDPEADSLASETAKLYNIRGRLAHEGQMDLGNNVSRLDKIVRRTLQVTLK